jgi:hypothetical protein
MGSPTHCCNLLANRTAVAWLQDAEETGGRGIIAYMNWEAGGALSSDQRLRHTVCTALDRTASISTSRGKWLG